MNVFFNNAAHWLLRASWQAAVLAVLILAIQWIAGSRLSARMRYNLWMLVVLRLILPAIPSSPLSIHNILAVPQKATAIARTTPVAEVQNSTVVVLDVQPQLTLTPTIVQPKPAAPPATPMRSWRDYTIPAAALLYLMGLAFLLSRIFIATMKLKLQSRSFTPITDPEIQSVLDDARHLMHIRRRITLLETPTLATPALMGIFNAKILLPTRVLTDFHPSELRLIFLHELAHLRRNDVAINWLITILQIFHWFNPFIWLAFNRLRAERELACDELVLSSTQNNQRREYGNTMIKLLQAFSGGNALPGAVGILEGQAPLRRRITMIAQFDAKQHRTWIALLSAIILAMICLTDSASGQQNAPQRGAGRHPQPRAQPQPQPEPVSNGFKPDPPPVGGANPVGGDASAGQPMVLPRFANIPQNRDAEAANAQTRTALDRKVPEVKFESVGLTDVIAFLQDVSGLNFYVDWKACENNGISKDTPITIRLKNVAASEILRLVLREASPELRFQIEGGIVVISPNPPQPVAVIKAYNVEDLTISDANFAPTRKNLEESLKNAADENARNQARRQLQDYQMMADQTKSGRMQELVTLIENSVAPYTNTGMTVRAFDTKLIITADEAGHQEVAKVLNMLRDKDNGDAHDPKPAKTGAGASVP